MNILKSGSDVVTGTGENISPQLVPTDTEWLQMSMLLNVTDSAGVGQMFNQTLNVLLKWFPVSVYGFLSGETSDTLIVGNTR